MNKKRILALADLIEANEGDFDMSNWTHSCGTPACIGGWAAWEALDRPSVLPSIFPHGRASSWLDISDEQGDALFIPDIWLSAVTASQAATVLRHLAETGEVDWNIVDVPEYDKDDDK